MYQWKCTYCDEEVRASSVDRVKKEGKTHLNLEHRDELAVLFQDKWAGKDCQGIKCNAWFPADGDFTGFKCPDCGHDHFAYFAGQHVWVETTEVDQ